MKEHLARTAALALALALVAGPARAQIFNQPVYYQPTHGIGLTIAGDFALGVNSDAELVFGEKPLAYGGRITLGVPKFTVTAGASMINPKGGLDSEIGFGANFGVSLFNVPAVPVAVALQAGVGYVKFGGGGPGSDVTNLDLPLGVALGLKVPSPVLSITPWVAPRLHVQRVSVSGLSASETGFGASGGINIGLPTGLGFHAALDWLSIADVNPLRLGVGAHFKFSIPGLGMVGM